MFTYSGLLEGFNSAAQAFGSILVGPLMTLFRVGDVMTWSMLSFAMLAMIIMCLEKDTGGTMPSTCVTVGVKPPKCTGAISGTWNILQIFPIFIFGGIPYGIIEMIRRVIPQQIMGGDEHKLKKMDSLVHVYYEIAGTSGAFFSAYVSLICGKAYGTIITPPLYTFAAISWYFLGLKSPEPSDEDLKNQKAMADAANIFQKAKLFLIYCKLALYGFFESVYDGGLIVFFDTRFQWLFFGYTIPLVMHRYIENGVGQYYAKLELEESAYASFIISGSNFGELLGALFVFWNLNTFYTPIPFVRWDALVLNFTWLFYNAVRRETCPGVETSDIAGIMAAVMAFISAGWAAGDVSMAAYIQSNIPNLEISTKNTNPLGAVMSFLYASYIVIYAIISPVIGKWIDEYKSDADWQKKLSSQKGISSATKKMYLAKQQALLKEQKDVYFFWIAGVFFSLISIPIFFNTFVPKGSWAWNPRAIGDDIQVPQVELVNMEDDEVEKTINYA